MNELAISAISLFSGVGMLDEGLRAGLDYLGFAHRTICHIEREAHAAAVLVARMEEGSLDAAPIWSDVSTFDARQWRGKVDCIVAGFPCQDLSVAGRRAGLDGKRSGLFFEVVRIAEDSGAELLFLENVGGIATATAAVVDEEEGDLEERAAAHVVGELADLGWDSEWITLPASDVGASHGRERWFCLAWRMADAARHVGDRGRIGQAGRWRGVRQAGNELVDANGEYVEGGIGDLGSSQGWQKQTGSVALPSRTLFAPGPSYLGWGEAIRQRPEIAPALKSNFQCMVNGLAFDMDDSRAARLKCIGNGVVPLQAATAFVILARRAGIFEASRVTQENT